MSNRFHSKYHKHNHHTRPTDREGSFPDSAYDPIASEDSPFQGDFYLDGNLFALSSVLVNGTLSSTNEVLLHDLTVYNNLSVLGSLSYFHTDLLCQAPVLITTVGDYTPALTVSQTGNAPIARFLDTNHNRPITFSTTGQVGIGTTTPTCQLQITELSQSLSAEFLIESAYTSSVLQLKTPNESNSVILFKTPYHAYASINGSPALSSLYFNIGTATVANITSKGLDITGSASINNFNSAALRLGNNDNNGWLITKELVGNSFNIWQGISQNAPITNRFIIDSTGNIGIGTVVPNQKLTVIGSISATNTINGNTAIFNKFRAALGAPDNSNSSTIGYAFGDDGDTGLFSKGLGNVSIFANNEEIFTTNSSNTTITKPLSVTTVNGDASIFNKFRAGQGAPNNAKYSTIGYAFGSDGDTGIFSKSEGNVSFYTNNEEIIAANNVGVTITKPLSVSRLYGDISTFNVSVSAPSLSGTHYGDGFNLTNVYGTDVTKLPLAGGVLTGDLIVAIGKVGIGVMNPTSKLEVQGDSDFYGKLTIHGDLSSTGNQYFANTYFSTTSALSVVNSSPVGDVAALYVGQSGPGNIASFYDIDQNVEILHVGGNNSNSPNVGVKTSVPNKDLTVQGEISSSGIIWDTSGNSALWNTVYNIVQALSASWTGTGQLLANTVGISAGTTFILPQNSTDIEILSPSTAVTSITAFINGVKGITYTLTNKTFNPITIYATPKILIRRGNGWRSQTASMSGSYLVLPLSGSCSLRADNNDYVSIW